MGWLGVLLLVVLMLGLKAAGPPGAYEAPLLLIVLNFAFSTLTSVFIAFLVARSFLARSAPAVLLLGSGVLVWGMTAVASSQAGQADPNVAVTIHNLGVWVAAACHVLSALLAGRRNQVRNPSVPWLIGAYAGAFAVAALITLLAVGGRTPLFFVQGHGGTLLRQLVLGSAIAMFVAAAMLLQVGGRGQAAFQRWYALALALLAVGLFGVLIQASFSSVLGWIGRGAQYLGGVCMLVAAFTSVHETRAWSIPLETALRETEERYRNLFENMTEGFFLAEIICDRQGQPVDYRYLDANAAFEPLTGLKREAIVGRTVRELLPAVEPVWIETYGQVALSGKPVRIEEFAGPLGRRYSTSAYSPRPGQFACFFTDVTERKRAELALLRANEQLREADRRKDEFLGMLSHELRNPLAPIRNALYLLDRSEPSGPQAERARKIMERQIVHLTRIVDDLLDVTRITRGKVQLRQERADLAETIRRAAEDLRPVLGQQNLSLVLDLPAEPLWADIDVTRMTQVVGNLLHNAGKFTPAGGRVTVSLRGAGEVAEIQVRDTGVGIEPELLDRIFEPFVQGESSLARTRGGLGLGLAQVKGLVELHGGTVSATSPGAGQGAEFTLRLPLPQRLAPRAPGRECATARSPTLRRVLVVDDNRDAAESLAEMVRLLGHDTRVAYEGSAAVKLAGEYAPDIVLCDLGLPDMSGYAVARELRASGVRLIAVSGYAQEEDLKKASAAGFDHHIAKPPDPAEIEKLFS